MVCFGEGYQQGVQALKEENSKQRNRVSLKALLVLRSNDHDPGKQQVSLNATPYLPLLLVCVVVHWLYGVYLTRVNTCDHHRQQIEDDVFKG